MNKKLLTFLEREIAFTKGCGRTHLLFFICTKFVIYVRYHKDFQVLTGKIGDFIDIESIQAKRRLPGEEKRRKKRDIGQSGTHLEKDTPLPSAVTTNSSIRTQIPTMITGTTSQPRNSVINNWATPTPLRHAQKL